MGKLSKYKFYKTTEESWIEEIPEHWEIYRLKHIFGITKRIVGELGHDVLSITQRGIKVKDTQSGAGQLSMDYSKYQQVDKGDFAMNHMDLLTGFVDISKYDGVISPDYRVFKLIHTKSDAQFLLYILQLSYTQRIFFKHGKGVSMLGRWRLPAENFKNFLIPLPTKEEQIKITNFLDFKLAKINRFIHKKKQLIKLLNEQKAGVINHAVTKGLDSKAKIKSSGIEWLGDIPEHWEVKPLKHFVSHNDETLQNSTDADYWLKYIDIGNVDSEGAIGEIVEYKFREAPSRARRIVKNGDVIISTVRTYLKAIAKITDDTDLIVSTGFAVLRPKSNIDSDFLNYAVRANYFIEDVCSNSYGVSYPAINASDLVTLKLAVPNTVLEQKRIVQLIKSETEKVEKTIATIEKEITLTHEYKTALIAEAVTGKIDVRDFVIPVHEEETYEDIEEELDMVAEDAEEIE